MSDVKNKEINVSYCRERLAEKLAILLDRVEHPDVPIYGDKSRIRAWELTTTDDVDMLERFLLLYSSANPDAVEGQMYVQDPLIDNQACPGKWRSSGVSIYRTTRSATDESDGRVLIIQSLALGFLDDLDITGLESRSIKSAGDPATLGFNIRQAWMYVNPKKLNSILTTLNAIAVAGNQYIDGVLWTGPFSVGAVDHDRNTDGSCTVWRDLYLVTTITETTKTTQIELIKHETLSEKEVIKSFLATASGVDAGTDLEPTAEDGSPPGAVSTGVAFGSEGNTTAPLPGTSRILSVSFIKRKIWRWISPSAASLAALEGITDTEWATIKPTGFHFFGRNIEQDKTTGALVLTVSYSDNQNHRKVFYWKYYTRNGVVEIKELTDATDADFVADTFFNSMAVKAATTSDKKVSVHRNPNTGLLSASGTKVSPVSAAQIAETLKGFTVTCPWTNGDVDGNVTVVVQYTTDPAIFNEPNRILGAGSYTTGVVPYPRVPGYYVRTVVTWV